MEKAAARRGAAVARLVAGETRSVWGVRICLYAVLAVKREAARGTERVRALRDSIVMGMDERREDRNL